MKKVTFSAKARYKFDNFVSKGTGQMIYGLGLFSVAFILFCSTLLLFVGFRPEGSDGMNLPESIWLNLTHVLDPGTVGGNEGGWPFLIFMMTVTLTGLIIITILIGLISNGIMDKLETLRKGRSFVIEQNHVVILGWSSKIFTIISELIIANANQKDAAIVILADKDKVAMEDEIRDKVKSFDTTRVICRTGNRFG
jgi:ion channel POLLUX/CASTOR